MQRSAALMRTRRHWLWLIPLLLLTFWLGAHYLDARPIWDDEAYSLKDSGSSSTSPVDIWNEVADRNPWHPPGFFIVLNVWGRLVSRNPVALRVLALLFGVLAVAWTYRLGRDNVNANVGLYGAVILGSGVMLVYYLDQIRVYTLLTLLTSFTLWLYLRIVRRPNPRPIHWLFLCLSGAGLLYAHYFGAIVLAAIGLYHLLFVAKNRRWWAVTGVLALAGLLFLPWTDVLLHALRMFVEPHAYNDRALDDVELLQALAFLFSNGVVVLLIAALLPALAARLRGGWRFWFFTAATLIPLLAINVVVPVISTTRLRYLLMLWPLFALVAALGLAWLGQHGKIGRWASLAILLVWVGAGVVNAANLDLIRGLGGAGYFFPYQRVVRLLSPQALDSDLIVGYWPEGSEAPNYNSNNYYAKQLPSTPILVSSAPRETHAIDPAELADRDRIWLAYVPKYPVEAEQSFKDLQAFVGSYAQCSRLADTPDLTIELYARTPVCCGPGDSPLVRFGDGMITLTGLDQMTVNGSPKVTLGWSIRADVPIQVYSVTLQLFDGSGNKVAQQDYGLPPRAFACQTTPLDTTGLPSGDYELRTSVYAWQTQQRLPGVTASGQSGDLLPVGSIHVG